MLNPRILKKLVESVGGKQSNTRFGNAESKYSVLKLFHTAVLSLICAVSILGALLYGVAPFVYTASAATASLRTTEYYVPSTGSFTGSTYDLTLNQDLTTDYFVLIRGSEGDGDATGSYGANAHYVSLVADPNGTGDLVTSGATNRLSFARGSSAGTGTSWTGVFTVVECVNDCTGSGFTLLGMNRVLHSGASVSGTATLATAWGNINNVVPFGGFSGAGCDSIETAITLLPVCHVRIWPSSSNTINWSRDGGETLTSATSTVATVEWGTDWLIQGVNITGSAGGKGADLVSHYDTVAISAVSRANTWVWGSGHTTDNGLGDSAEGVLLTLGDGVSTNTTEATLAAGSAISPKGYGKDMQVYAMTHSGINVSYGFLAEGNKNNFKIPVTVAVATGATQRLGVTTKGMSITNNQHPRGIFSARYLNNTTVEIERRRSGQAMVAWTLGTNFAGLISDITQDHYRWRNDNGNEAIATFAQVEDTKLTALTKNTKKRIRFGVSNQISADTLSFQLQVAETATCSSGTYTAVPTNTSGHWQVLDSAHYIDGTATTDVAEGLSNGATTFVPGEIKDTSNTTSALTIGGDKFTEIEFSVMALDASTSGGDYCFRLSSMDTYSIYAEVSISAGAGSLSVDIVDATSTSVVSPSVTMNSTTFSFASQTTTGLLGTASEKIRVTNSTGASAWNLTIAAVNPTFIWDGAPTDFDFNDPTAQVEDGPDLDLFGGQMSFDPTTNGVITPQGGCSSTGISLGSAGSFSEGVTDSITLMSADGTADTSCYWDLTGIDVSQAIPAEQIADSYYIDMVLTVVAA